MNTPPPPHIAIVSANTLTAMGLEGLITRMMPGVEVHLFASTAELEAAGMADFVHYFVSAEVLLADVPYYLARRRHTVVLTTRPGSVIPQEFHAINVAQGEKALVRDILRLSSDGHRHHGAATRECPDGARPSCPPTHPQREVALTRREVEVLRHIVLGHINKEIANHLSVSPTTIISHRKNLTEKLGIKAVSALTVYAVMHGIVSLEEL